MKTTRRLLAAAFAVLAVSAAPALAAGQQPPAAAASAVLAGVWEGEAETDRWPVFMTLRLEPGPAGLGGSLVFLGNTVPLSKAEVTGEALTATAGDKEDPTPIVLALRRHGDGLVGRFRQAGSDLPIALRFVPALPKPGGRLDAWGQDIDALDQRLLRADRSFSPGERALFLEHTAQLRRDLPTLDDAQIVMRIASAMALADNAHTRLYILRNRTELRRLPIRLWWFRDGAYVVRATVEHRALLGCRLEDVAGVEARQARDHVAPAFAGNPAWVDYKSTYALTSPEALRGMGLTPSPDAAEMGFACPGGPRRVTLQPLPLVRNSRPTETWWDLSPARPADPAWVHALGPAKAPLYLRDPNAYYWFERLPGDLLYFQYNRASEHPTETTEAFARRLLAELDRRPAKALVVDLRFNTGGDGGLATPLMNELRARTKGLPRFVVVGRATFSGGLFHAAKWAEAGRTTFVGEPVGDDLDYWSEGGNIVLPNSGLYAHFGNGRHSYGPGPCPDARPCENVDAPDLAPDLPVSLTWAEYRDGRDPAMEAIAAALRR